MEDLVETALENHREEMNVESEDESEFNAPVMLFVGCGTAGAQIVDDGLGSRAQSSQYPDVETLACQTEPIPKSVTADIVIVTGDLNESIVHELLPAVARATPDDTLVIAIPILPSGETNYWNMLSRLVEVTETVVPVANGRHIEATDSSAAISPPAQLLVRKLATDLVAMLGANLQWSPQLHRLWPALENGGLTIAYRDQVPDIAPDTTPADTLTTLVDRTLDRPLGPDTVGGTDCLSLLRGDQSLTLNEAQAVREAIAGHSHTVDSEPVFSVAISDSTAPYGLTLLFTGRKQAQLNS